MPAATSRGEFILEAKALGAVACFSVDAPPRNIMQALLKIIYPTESIADRLIQGFCGADWEILGALFRAAHEGLAPTMALVEPALDPVLDAMAAGGLSRWLDTVRGYDDGTYQHCLLVAGFAANFAQHLRFPRFDQRRVMRAALVHDVGKAKIPRTILNKPGQLGEDELEVMGTHATLGFQLLKDGGECDQATLDAVRHHHEMLDGSGYPDGLRGGGVAAWFGC